MVALVDRTNTTTPIASTKTRFTAMIVSGDLNRRGALAHRLRQYGARNVVEAGSQSGALAKGRVDGPHDLCIVDGTSVEGPILPTISELRSMRWRRNGSGRARSSSIPNRSVGNIPPTGSSSGWSKPGFRSTACAMATTSRPVFRRDR